MAKAGGAVLTPHERNIALWSLRHTAWKLHIQVVDKNASPAYEAAWYAGKYFLGEVEALIAKLEKTDA